MRTWLVRMARQVNILCVTNKMELGKEGTRIIFHHIWVLTVISRLCIISIYWHTTIYIYANVQKM